MTTRPLRHADDREQERANIEYERALLIQRLGWLDAVLAAMETRQRGGESDVTRGAHQPQSLSCRSIVEEGRQMDPPDRPR